MHDNEFKGIKFYKTLQFALNVLVVTKDGMVIDKQAGNKPVLQSRDATIALTTAIQKVTESYPDSIAISGEIITFLKASFNFTGGMQMLRKCLMFSQQLETSSRKNAYGFLLLCFFLPPMDSCLSLILLSSFLL